jgi:hypothetical protein
MPNSKAEERNTTDFQVDSAGITTLEIFYQGLKTKDVLRKQLRISKLFIMAVASDMWDNTPPAERRDLCYEVEENLELMEAAHQEVNLLR